MNRGGVGGRRVAAELADPGATERASASSSDRSRPIRCRRYLRSASCDPSRSCPFLSWGSRAASPPRCRGSIRRRRARSLCRSCSRRSRRAPSWRAWPAPGTGAPNEAAPSTVSAKTIRKREENERAMRRVITASPSIRKSDPRTPEIGIALFRICQFAVPGAPIRAVIATTSAATRSSRWPTSRVSSSRWRRIRIDDQRGGDAVDQLGGRVLGGDHLAQQLAPLGDGVGQLTDERAQRLIGVDDLGGVGDRKIGELGRGRPTGRGAPTAAPDRCGCARAHAPPG